MITKNRFPKIHYYDQDFVSLYQKSWSWLTDSIFENKKSNGFAKSFFNYHGETIDQVSACFSTFFLVYSNGYISPTSVLDNFYAKQEENGAIRGAYSLETGEPILLNEDNPENIQPPLFSWAEYNLYHKVGNKKRLEEILKPLELYYEWLESLFLCENKLYHVPFSATTMTNSPRAKETYYPIDFNAQQALNALYISKIADALNEKEIALKFKKRYFSLKANMNALMWDKEDNFYYDLNKKGEMVKVRTIASYWTLLAELPNEDKIDHLINYLFNSKEFGTHHPFPSLSQADPHFSHEGNGFNGSVFPHFVFMVVKGLEKIGRYETARESVLRHIYSVLDTLNPEEENKKGALYNAYSPSKDGKASWDSQPENIIPFYMPFCALSTITLMIENVVGLHISIPRKTVSWIVSAMEVMGIENLSLKRNFISILSQKSGRGWEIRLESEKLYYFTINILGKKEKTLPIPSGRCSMLLEKL